MADLLNIEEQLTAVLRTKCNSYFSTTYPNIYITSSDKNVKDPTFPTVYIHQLNSTTLPTAIRRGSITGFRVEIQIEVTDNESQKHCKDVMDYIIGLMLKLKFNLVGSPYSDNTSESYRRIIRFRRGIAGGDTFLGIK